METNQTTNDINTESSVYGPNTGNKSDSNNFVIEQVLCTSNTQIIDTSDTRSSTGIKTSTPPHDFNTSSVTSPSDHTKYLEYDANAIMMLTERTNTDGIYQDTIGNKSYESRVTQLKYINNPNPNITDNLNNVTLIKSTGAKSTGYRNRNSFVPVNQQTAIHLPRPVNIVAETKNSPIILPRPMKDVTVYKQTNIHLPRPKNLVYNIQPAQVQRNLVHTDGGLTTKSTEPAQRPSVVYPGKQFDAKHYVSITPVVTCSAITPSLYNVKHQKVDPPLGIGETKANLNKWASLLPDHKDELCKLVKKPKLGSMAENFVAPTLVKCQNNNSKVKKRNKLASSSGANKDISISTSSAAGMHNREVLRNKKSIKRQANFDDGNDGNISNSKVRNNETKTNAMPSQSTDVSSYKALSSTSTCNDQLKPDAYQQPNKCRETLFHSENNDDPRNTTDANTTSASKEVNDLSSCAKKKKIKKKNEAGNITESNYETVKRENTTELLKKQHELRKNSPNINAIKLQCNQRSRSFYDLESRYLGTIDEEDLHKTDTSSDVIREVEAHKLSSVKDHRLLTLSEEEKVFLRNKSYLNDDATDDVKRRFSQKKTDTLIQSHCISMRGNSPESTQEILNGQVCTNNSVNQERSNESMSTATFGQQHLRTVSPQTTPRDVNNPVVKSEFTNSPRPVIRLQRIDNQIHMATTSQTIGRQSKPSDNATSPGNTDPSNGSNTNKVYYVINKEDLGKIKSPANSVMEKNRKRVVTVNSGPRLLSNMSSLIQQHSSQTLVENQNSSYQATTKLPKKEQAVKSTKVNTKHSNSGVRTGEHVRLLGNTYTNNQIIKHTPSAFVLNQKPLTVKELLALKRQAKESNFTFTGDSRTPMPVQVINVPIVVSERNTNRLPITSAVMQDTQIEEKPVTVLTPIEELQESVGYLYDQPSTSRSYKESGHSAGLQCSERLIRIVNPSNCVPESDIRRTIVTHSPIQSAYLEQFQTMSYADNVSPKAVQEDKPIHIKVGEKTMIVCNRPSKDFKNRKTLPAPKPKHKVDNDYKWRRRRSSKCRVKENQRCLQTKLKKLLMKSEDSLHKLAQTLDLVPLDVLKQALTEPTAEFDAVVRNKPKAYMENTVQIASASNYLMNSQNHLNDGYRQEMVVIPSANIANIMQIFTDMDGVCSYSNHQVQIKYRQYGVPAGDHTTQSEFPCRLKFDKDGFMQQISIETIRQGLYLINKKHIDLEFTRNQRNLNTTLIIYPPHVGVLPPGSLSIAVGDIFSSAQKDLYTCESYGIGDIQEELQRFLWPITMDNVEELVDKRYGSVTDRNLSPRCCSPRFYTEAMAHAFDRCGNVLESDPSSEDLTAENSVFTRRLDGIDYNSEFQTVRSSERATALKIRQNELFESCRKLKSLQTNSSTEPKKKRRRVKKRDNTSTDTTQQTFEDAVAELLTLSEAAQQEAHDERFIDVLTETDADSQDIDVE